MGLLETFRSILDAETAREVDWPRNSRGHAKLYVTNDQADRFIAAGAATEDDLIRMSDAVPEK